MTMRRALIALFPGHRPGRLMTRVWLIALYHIADITDWVNLRAEVAIIELERQR